MFVNLLLYQVVLGLVIKKPINLAFSAFISDEQWMKILGPKKRLCYAVRQNLIKAPAEPV
jgi:hypothetical protein